MLIRTEIERPVWRRPGREAVATAGAAARCIMLVATLAAAASASSVEVILSGRIVGNSSLATDSLIGTVAPPDFGTDTSPTLVTIPIPEGTAFSARFVYDLAQLPPAQGGPFVGIPGNFFAGLYGAFDAVRHVSTAPAPVFSSVQFQIPGQAYDFADLAPSPGSTIFGEETHEHLFYGIWTPPPAEGHFFQAGVDRDIFFFDPESSTGYSAGFTFTLTEFVGVPLQLPVPGGVPTAFQFTVRNGADHPSGLDFQFGVGRAFWTAGHARFVQGTSLLEFERRLLRLNFAIDSATARELNAVPEPSTAVLLLIPLAAGIAVRLRGKIDPCRPLSQRRHGSQPPAPKES